MDKISINKLQLPVIIGDLEQERHWPQKLLFDLTVTVDLSRVAQSDQLIDTVDYVALRDEIQRYTQAHTFQLVETLASKLADHLQTKFNLEALSLTVTKRPAALSDIDSVAITIERHVS